MFYHVLLITVCIQAVCSFEHQGAQTVSPSFKKTAHCLANGISLDAALDNWRSCQMLLSWTCCFLCRCRRHQNRVDLPSVSSQILDRPGCPLLHSSSQTVTPETGGSLFDKLVAVVSAWGKSRLKRGKSCHYCLEYRPTDQACMNGFPGRQTQRTSLHKIQCHI